MYPLLLDWHGIQIPAWHVLFVLGCISGLIAAIRLNAHLNRPIPTMSLQRAFISAYIFGYFGARILNIFVDQEPFSDMADFFALLTSIGGMVFYGGLIFGGLAAAITFSAQETSLRQALDICMPGVFIGLAIGRIGCFLNGDDYGQVLPIDPMAAAPWWGVSFKALGDIRPRYPIQIIEAIGALALFILSFYLTKKRATAILGLSGSLSLIAYAISRFFLEYLRGDERGWLFSPALSTSQAISLLAAGLGLVLACGSFLYSPKKHSC